MFSSKESLRQMSLEDSDNFLLKLSEDRNFKSFKNIVLVYSYEDGYAPFKSSKIIVDSSNKSSSKMAKNIWENVRVSFYYNFI